MRNQISVLWAASCALGGCVEEQRYVVENKAFALSADAAPVFVDDENNMLFVAQATYDFPISPPSASALKRVEATPAPPFPHAPWIDSDDVDYTFDYVVQNGGSDPVSVLVSFDGINEFNVYTPGPEDLHQWERRFGLKPGERAVGSVSTLEANEIAVDLATVVNGAPNSNLVVQFQSQSGRDPRVSPYIPGVIPGLVGIVASVSTSVAAPVTLELSVRAEDHGQRMAKRGAKHWTLPQPAAFVPIAPVEPEE